MIDRKELPETVAASSAGISYRRTMCWDDRAGTNAQWGSTFEATIIDDDWVQIVLGTVEKLGTQDAGMATSEADEVAPIAPFPTLPQRIVVSNAYNAIDRRRSHRL